MGEKSDGAYWAVIPSEVRYDENLKPNAKLLYGELTSLCHRSGYCWATNEYFADLYGVSISTVSRWISQLEKRGYIRCEMAATDSGSERRIYAGIFLVTEGGIDKMSKTPLDEKSKTGIGKKSKGGLDENDKRGPALFVKQNNKNINNIPPIVPQGGRPSAALRRRRGPRAAPDWKPERFVGFWRYYPRKENKQRAMDAWDNLKPGDELIDTMGRALKKLKATDEWQRGIGIPHAATWLNNARWEDAEGLMPHNGDEDGRSGWAEDPEVL